MSVACNKSQIRGSCCNKIVLSINEGIISAAADLMASPSKPTELEAEIAPRVGAEKQERAAVETHTADNAAALDDLLTQIV